MLNRIVIANLHATSHIQDRYPQAENQPHILALSFFSDTQIQRYNNQKS